jgi:single-strand DNA-binding protein
VKFGVAVSRRVKDDATGQWKDADTSFFDVTAWRSLAENVAETLTQGTRVVVVGRLRTNTWETPEGERRSKVEIEAEEIGPSLKWASAKIEKQGRSAGAGDWAGNVAVGVGGAQEETPLDA